MRRGNRLYDRRLNAIWILIAAALPMVVAAAAIMLYRYHFPGPISTASGAWGEFGDYLGGILNPVIGVITLVLLVRTLLSQQEAIQLQGEELALQRNELQLQRMEASKAATALEAQYRAIVLQSFEQTFFTWLESYAKAIDSIEFRRGHSPSTGTWALRTILQDGDVPSSEEVCIAIEQYQESDYRRQTKLSENWASKIKGWWTDIAYRPHEAALGVALRVLYTLIRWIDTHPGLTPFDRWTYVSILRARLSSHELTVLFFNSFTENGKPFTAYVNKYALLDNLPDEPHHFMLLARHVGASPFSEEAFSSAKARAKRIFE